MGGAGSGTECFDEADCVAPQYCGTLPGRCGQMGQCSTKPSECDTDDAPVCGCNGTTYSNRCEAEANGVSIYVSGPCEDVTDECTIFDENTGCFGSVRHCQRTDECGFGICLQEVCQFPEGFCPGDGDPSEPDGVPAVTGRCAPGPCEPSLDEAPVCGCDGVTYSNTDSALLSQVSVRHQGACE